MIKGNLLYSDTFETNNLSRWTVATDGTSTATTSDSYAKSGNYSLKIWMKQNSAYALIRKILSNSYGTIHIKFWFYIPTGFSLGSNTFLDLLDIKDSNWTLIWFLRLRNDAGTFKLSYCRKGGDNVTVNTSITVPTGTWVCYEMRITFSDTAGTVSIWKNDKREYDASSLNTGTKTANIIEFGSGWQNYSCDACYYDDIEIATGFIGSNVLKGLVSFNFDDGQTGVYNYARSILNTANVPGTCFIITDYIGGGGYMTSAQLQTLYSEGWEMGSHTVNHVDLTEQTDETIESELANSKTDLENLGFIVYSFASPFGTYNNNVIARAAKYYYNYRIADEGYNFYPINDYLIKVKSVFYTTSVDTVKGYIDETIASGQRLVLLFHDIVTENPGSEQYLNTDLQSIVDYLSGKYITPVKFYDLTRISAL